MASAAILSFQPELPQVLPTIHGNTDYRDFRDQLLRIDQLLLATGLEEKLVRSDLERWSAAAEEELTPSAQQYRQLHSRRALRCTIARLLLKEDYRGFASRLADSALLQYFCGVSRVDLIKVPSKSTLQRDSSLWPESEIRAAIYELLSCGVATPQKIHLPQALDLESAFLDTTCLEANIHYPVDWVLLRDATRTLVKAIQLIRTHGLKHRMPAPETFLTRINTLCMAMTQRARTQSDSLRQRKRTLRQMDRVVGTVRSHARRYHTVLDQRWQETDLTRPQAEQVLRRMDRVLKQLPQARQQARQRILKGEAVPNEKKILSLYEPDVHVIVRRKAGVEVEFGNTLLLAESSQGLIMDWELFQKSAPADSLLLPRSIGRMEEAYGQKIKAVGADRGFDSQVNQDGLAQEKIYNGVCPRNPRQLRQRKSQWKFKRLQRRRAQTEGRIAILKNTLGAGTMRSKGFASRNATVTWTVLVHNLWVLVRLQRRQPKEMQAEAA